MLSFATWRKTWRAPRAAASAQIAHVSAIPSPRAPARLRHLDGRDPRPAVRDRQPADGEHLTGVAADAGERLRRSGHQHSAQDRRLPVLATVVIRSEPGVVGLSVDAELSARRRVAAGGTVCRAAMCSSPVIDSTRAMMAYALIVTLSDAPVAVRKKTVGTVREWRAAGITPAQFRSLTRAGDLVRVRHGVYATRSAVESATTDPRQAHALRVAAARTAVGRHAVASHQSAAVLHGIDLLRDPGDDAVG